MLILFDLITKKTPKTATNMLVFRLYLERKRIRVLGIKNKKQTISREQGEPALHFSSNLNIIEKILSDNL